MVCQPSNSTEVLMTGPACASEGGTPTMLRSGRSSILWEK